MQNGFIRSLSNRLVLMALGVVCLSTTVSAGNLAAEIKLRRWIDNGSVLLHDEAGRVLLAYRPDQVLIPASIIKIYTALVALEELGEDFRFKTGFFSDGDGNLGVKGWGDPQLISEEIHLIAEKLLEKGIRRIRQVKLDLSAFDAAITISGRSNSLNPYDAINGALIVNFNTLNLGRHEGGSIYSAEPVTPLTPLARELGTILQAGTEDRFNLSTRPENVGRYAGELLIEILKLHGIMVEQPDAGITVIDENWVPVYEHLNTASLKAVIQGLLKYSNNLIANQIYLVAGAAVSGYPATQVKARAVFRSYAGKRFPGHTGHMVIDEASGISRDNRLSAAAMMAILEAFRPWADLLDLRKGVLVKSGTLTGVYNYAGYIKTPNGHRPFVIMLNQTKNRRDRILDLLKNHMPAAQLKQ